MAFTDTQKAQIRRALGWSARYYQFDSRLDQAMSSLATQPEVELLVTGTLENNGILANIDDIQTKLRASHARLKANKVGSIELRQQEVVQLRSEGDRWVNDLARILGVETRQGGIFGGAGVNTFAGFGGPYGGAGGNFVGK